MNTKLNHIQDWTAVAREVNWSVTGLAKHCGVSSRTLERFFLRWTRQTPKQWLAAQRHTEATKLLRQGKSVKEAAQLSGYKYASSFSREFHKQLKQSPITQPITSANQLIP